MGGEGQHVCTGALRQHRQPGPRVLHALAQGRDHATRAALQGEVDALRGAGVAIVGFYSTSYQWNQITGGTGTTFSRNPVWVAGTGSLATAQANCATTSFTGGAITLAQYAANGYDGDTHC